MVGGEVEERSRAELNPLGDGHRGGLSGPLDPTDPRIHGRDVGGAVGGLAGGLIGMGIPEYEAKRYEGRIRKGGILLSVHCDNADWATKAKDMLQGTGAEDISSTSEAPADFAKSDRPMPRAATTGSGSQ